MAAKNNQKVGFWHAARDVLVASINKGQFPIAALWVLALVMILRMPQEKDAELVFRVFDGIERRMLLGYLIALVAVVGWFSHARYQRRIIKDEMDRLAELRNELQRAQIGDNVKSSKGPKK